MYSWNAGVILCPADGGWTVDVGDCSIISDDLLPLFCSTQHVGYSCC